MAGSIKDELSGKTMNNLLCFIQKTFLLNIWRCDWKRGKKKKLVNKQRYGKINWNLKAQQTKCSLKKLENCLNPDGVKTYTYDRSVGKISETELMENVREMIK